MMTDLTLSEYEAFSENELKEILLEEKRKMYGAESFRTGIEPNKIGAFREVLLKSCGCLQGLFLSWIVNA
jgi:hypothetical protein